MAIRIIPTIYEVKDPLHIRRWMCGNCGLVFDFQFDPSNPGWTKFDPPLEVMNVWQDENGEYQYDEPERREICPRCSVDFSEDPLIPVAIDKFNFRDFLKTTFIVEDNSHENIVREISNCFDKDISVVQAGNSSTVKSFFRLAKSQGELDFTYFVVDGDNQNLSKEFTQESHFIHLDKYCIENYLLDFKVCKSISGNKDVVKILLEVIHNKSKALGKNPLGEFLINRLSAKDIKPSLLSNIDASEFINEFADKLGFADVNKFREKYVKYCFETSKLGKVFPTTLVKAIRTSKVKPLPKE